MFHDENSQNYGEESTKWAGREVATGAIEKRML